MSPQLLNEVFFSKNHNYRFFYVAVNPLVPIFWHLHVWWQKTTNIHRATIYRSRNHLIKYGVSLFVISGVVYVIMKTRKCTCNEKH